MLTRRALRFALIITLALRLFTILVVLGGQALTPPNPPRAPHSPAVIRDLVERGPLSQRLLLPWYRWDTTHYLEIADEGYTVNLQNTVWPPLYPALIRLFSMVFQPSILAALIVSTFASISAFTLLYLFITDVWDESLARRVVIWMAIFPTGFYLMAAYTESLFITFALATLLAARKRRWLLAGAMGALATLTRIPGVLLAAPVLWEAWQEFRSNGKKLRLSTTAESVVSLAAMPVSLGVFSAYMRFQLGAPWPWSNLSNAWHLKLAWPWTGLIGNLYEMSKAPIGSWTISQFYDVLLALWAVTMLIIGLRKMPFSLVLYTTVLLIPALVKILDNNLLMSVSRYMLPLFPLMVVTDRLFKTRGTRFAIAAFSLASQAWLLYLFYMWVWIA